MWSFLAYMKGKYMSKMVFRIKNILMKRGKKGVDQKTLKKILQIQRNENVAYEKVVEEMVSQGEVVKIGYRLIMAKFLNLKEAEVVRLNETYGFIKVLEDGSEYFVAGRNFAGALPNDIVRVILAKDKTGRDEAIVVSISQELCTGFGATVKEILQGGVRVQPDLFRFEYVVERGMIDRVSLGEKVYCKISKRGKTHHQHKLMITRVYGDSQVAKNCADSLLDANGIELKFSEDEMNQAMMIEKKGITEDDIKNRVDLRDSVIFTIDGSNTKDIDDAISIKRRGDMYELGVHIADVSHYVKPHSPIEKVAYTRGTSIYFADRVVPMIPPQLSNGICSLNPNVDRLAFSCIMSVTNEGQLHDFKFEKTVIRSKIQGVYGEVNEILSEKESDELKEKYKGLYDNIFLMKELANKLTRNKIARGAPEIETTESYITLDNNGVAVDVHARERGESEVIIEEFMLLANQAAATASKLKEIPLVHRVHEPPSEEKIEMLNTSMKTLGIYTDDIKKGMKPRVLAELIRKSRGTNIYPIVNRIVLRSMSKAKYYQEPIGHYGLGLDEYAQFTSPIRRYPDLVVHRILSDCAMGVSSDKIIEKYAKVVEKSSLQSTQREIKAMKMERQCDDIYKAEYMKQHVGEEYEGVITSAANHGIYVTLPSSVEGLVRTSDLPSGEYKYDEVKGYTNVTTTQTYFVGDKINIVCTQVDVSNGQIDFNIAK